jgi:tagatose-6-phosphate ketose/aldose isomerase
LSQRAQEPHEVDAWHAEVAAQSPLLAALLGRDADARRRAGYADTLGEILRQPLTWEKTGDLVAAEATRLSAFLRETGLERGRGHLLLTGCGSSLHAGECAVAALRDGLGLGVSAVPAGDLLTHAEACLPPTGPTLLVSLARSGDSPESVAAVERVQALRPEARHLAVTCNREGRLAARLAADPRARVLILDEATNDRSLIMTGSFTNLALAAAALAYLDRAAALASDARVLSHAGRTLLARHAEPLMRLGAQSVRAAVVLGTGDRLGAAREAALKLTETTAGAVRTFAESFLGLRHGPMSAVHADTLVLAFLSPASPAREYERDLLLELRHKGLGATTIVVGAALDAALRESAALSIDLPAAPAFGCGPLGVVAAQVLAFSRCLALGLKPDAPSPDDVITRVVRGFRLYEASRE